MKVIDIPHNLTNKLVELRDRYQHELEETQQRLIASFEGDAGLLVSGFLIGENENPARIRLNETFTEVMILEDA